MEPYPGPGVALKFSKGDLVTPGIDNVSSTTVPVLDVGITLDTDVGTVTRSSVKLKVTACALSESKHRAANVAAIEEKENDSFKALYSNRTLFDYRARQTPLTSIQLQYIARNTPLAIHRL